jgi:hypothetical protein
MISTPGSTARAGKATPAPIELEITRERITGSVVKRRAAGKDLDGRRQTFTDSQIRIALRLIEAGSRPPRSPGTGGYPGPPTIAASANGTVRSIDSGA